MSGRPVASWPPVLSGMWRISRSAPGRRRSRTSCCRSAARSPRAAVIQLLRGLPLEPVARRFWRRLLVAFVLVTGGFGWLAGSFLVHYPAAGARPMPIGAAAVAAAGLGIAIWAVAGVPSGAPAATRAERWRVAPGPHDRVPRLRHRAVARRAGPHADRRRAVEPPGDGAGRRSRSCSRSAASPRSRTSRAARSTALAIRLIAAIGLTAAAVAVLAVRFGYAGGVPAQAVVMPLGAGAGRRSAVRGAVACADPAGQPRLAPRPARCCRTWRWPRSTCR